MCSYPIRDEAMACPECGCDWQHADQPQPTSSPSENSFWRLWLAAALFIVAPSVLTAVLVLLG